MTDRVQAFRKAFGLPGHVFPLGLVPVGYPAENLTSGQVQGRESLQ